MRNLTAGEEAKTSIEKSTSRSGVVSVWELDLSSYDSVKKFAKRATSELDRLDALVENAGIATNVFNLAEGHERTITVNVISTFLLALLLLPKLKETKKAFPSSIPHLTIVSSSVHAWSKLPERNASDIFAALDDQKNTNMGERYPTSKLLELLVVREMAPKLNGTGVVLNILNPGLCHSALARDAGWAFYLFKLAIARTTEVGSRTLVASVVAGEESHGKYMDDGVVKEENISEFVTSQDGQEAGKKVWEQLKNILESIEPGVSKGF